MSLKSCPSQAGPRLHQLQAFALGIHLERDAAAVRGRRHVRRAAAVEIPRRHFQRRLGRRQLERLAVGTRAGDKLPANARAVTISGLPMKFIVVDGPSLRREVAVARLPPVAECVWAADSRRERTQARPALWNSPFISSSYKRIMPSTNRRVTSVSRNGFSRSHKLARFSTSRIYPS